LEENKNNKPKKKEEHAFREWLSDNLRYFELIIGIILIAVVIFFVVRAILGRDDTEVKDGARANVQVTTVSSDSSRDSGEGAVTASTSGEQPETSSVSATSEDAESTAAPTPTPEPTAAPVPSGLNEDSGDITTAVTNYITSLAGTPGNEAVVSYDDVKVYTYPGVNENSAVAFASYTYTYADYSDKVPGLTELYLTRAEDGSFQVADSIPDNAAQYMNTLSDNAEVQSLISTVTAQYQQVMAANPDLSAYVDSLG